MTARIPKVVVIGSSYVDMAIQCQSTPKPGQCVKGSGFSNNPSGQGPNQAIEASFCKCKASLVSCVGKDCFGDKIRENLVKFGVNIDNLFVAEAMNTGLVVTMVNQDGENISCFSAGANSALSPSHIESAKVEQEISTADCCVIDSTLNIETVVAAIRTAQINGTKTVLYHILSLKKAMESVAQLPQEFFSVNCFVCEPDIDGLTENSTGIVHDAKPVASDLVARGVSNVVVRCGRRGCLIVNKDSIDLIASAQNEQISVGCGTDAFVGALGASVAVDDHINTAVKFAMAAETLACRKTHLQENLPKKTDILEILLKHPD